MQFEIANQIYMEFFNHVADELFKSAKLQEINDWLEAGDPGSVTVAELIQMWAEYDHLDIAKHLRPARINKDHSVKFFLGKLGQMRCMADGGLTDVSWYGSDSTGGAKAAESNKDHLCRFMLAGDRIRRFGAFMSGDDAPVMARFAEFARAQPLGAKWGYAKLAGWMIESYPAEVESWLEADSLGTYND